MPIPRFLAVALLIALSACNDRASEPVGNGGPDSRRACPDPKHWSLGEPQWRGDIPEIHYYLSGSEVVMPPEYRIGRLDWEKGLREAAGFAPKPYLIIHADGQTDCESRRPILDRIAKAYACSPYTCYLISQPGAAASRDRARQVGQAGLK